MTAHPRLPFDPSGHDVLAFARDELRAGRGAAIATLAGIDGSAPRGLGAQMAVSADGCFAGSISSGCLGQAIIAQAQTAIARGRGGVLRYGAGSPFRDIVLPCGSGLDILYSSVRDAAPFEDALDALAARRPATLTFTVTGADCAAAAQVADEPSTFVRRYLPALRIVAAGAGPELVQLARMADAAGYTFTAMSPDNQILDACGAVERRALEAGTAPQIETDPWTAYVLLFHDREWERLLAPGALASPAFYVGAVGSRRTAAARRRMLLEDGVAEEDIERLRGPIGLAPATRDPSALAISVLAEIVAAWSEAWVR